MYPHLTKVLTDLGETDLQVHTAFVLNLGCVCLHPFEHPILSSRFPVTDLEKLLLSQREQNSSPLDLHAAIIKALEKHPNVFDIVILGKEPFGFVTSHHAGTFMTGRNFSLRVELPERMQKYRVLAWPEKPTEHFEVVSNGSLFATFAPIQDYPVWTHIGEEYRELLSTQIEKDTSVRSLSLGPSPIHPNFYFVLRKKRNQTLPLGTGVYTLKEDVFLVFDNNSQTNRDMAMDFFNDSQSALLDFYSLELIRNSPIEYHIEIFNHFSDLSNYAKEILAVPWWHIFKLSKFAHLGRISLSNIHKRYLEFETELFDFNRQHNRLLNTIKQHRILSKVNSYFYRITEPDIEVPQAFSRTLDHFENELRTFGNIRSLVIVSLLGAAVGAAITVLLTQVF